MEYCWTYCLRETGVLTQGPNKGKELNEHIQETMCGMLSKENTLESAREMAARHRSLEPLMKIEIVRRQYRSRPKPHFHYELVEVFP